MKRVFRVMTLAVVAAILTGCSKSEPLDVSNDPPKGAKAAGMNSAAPNSGSGATSAKPQGQKGEAQ